MLPASPRALQLFRPVVGKRLGLALVISAWCATTVISQVSDQQEAGSAKYRSVLALSAEGDFNAAINAAILLIEAGIGYERIFYRVAQAAEAGNLFDHASKKYSELLQKPEINPKVYFGLGLVYVAKKEYQAALELYRKCIEAAPTFALPYIELVNAAREIGDLEATRLYLQTRIELVTDPESRAAAALGLARYCNFTRQAANAEKYFALALSSDPYSITAHYQQSSALNQFGQLKQAKEAINESFALAEQRFNEDERQMFLNLRADNLFRLGEYDNAIGLFLASLQLARARREQTYEESALGYLGAIHKIQGKYSLALGYFMEALQVASANHGRVSAINRYKSLIQLGSIHFVLGNLLEAKNYFQAAEVETGTAGEKLLQSAAATSLGEVSFLLGERENAKHFYQRAADLSAQLQNSNAQAVVFASLSALYTQEEDFTRAADVVGRGLRLARDPASLDHELELILLNRQGELAFKTRETALALITYQQALKIAQMRQMPKYIWLAAVGLATVYRNLGQLELARKCLNDAIAVIEGVRSDLMSDDNKLGFFQDKVDVYKQLISLLLQLQNSTKEPGLKVEAFYLSERARARVFADLLAESKLDNDRQLPIELAQQRLAIQQQISRLMSQLLKEKALEPAKQNLAAIDILETDLSKADEEMADWVQKIRQHHSRYAALKYPEPVDLRHTQLLLKPNQVMLAYSLGEEISFLFAVSHTAYRVWQLPPAKQLQNKIDLLRVALTESGSGTTAWRAPAAKLYGDLIKPAAEFLGQQLAKRQARELIIVPDGALHRLPFEILLKADTGADVRKLPYLVSDYTLSYAPSATVLKSLKEMPVQAASAQKGLLVVADPQYDRRTQTPGMLAQIRAASGERWNFERLANSAREAKEIAALFPSADVWLREQANETAIKTPAERLRAYRVLHFSAHGLVNEQRPRLSGLVLTLPPEASSADVPPSDDGILSAYEIFNLKLNADLVTLSACETGLGKEVKGEGLMSLVRAFMYAGTPSVLASLWKVDDRATADLMIDFYKFWQQGKLSKAAALRAAQLNAIKAGNQPFYWAPFVLLGRSN